MPYNHEDPARVEQWATRAVSTGERHALQTFAKEERKSLTTVLSTLRVHVGDAWFRANRREPLATLEAIYRVTAYAWLASTDDYLGEGLRAWVSRSYCYMGKPLLVAVHRAFKHEISDWKCADNDQWAHSIVCTPVPASYALDVLISTGRTV